jgi:transcription initiation factor TFIIIB Brf1 subunit/transcription initiation factor TFIIB
MPPREFLPPLTDCCGVESDYKEGKAVCLKCGLCVGEAPFEIGADAWGRYTFRKKRRYTKYKRVTRLREVIKSLQGQGEAELPDDIVPYLKQRALRYPTSHFFDHHWVRQQLKREKRFLKFAESSVRLCLIIFPDYKPVLSERIELRNIETVFHQVSEAFDVVKDRLGKEVNYRRLTFLHYGFCLEKILELLDYKKDAQSVKDHTRLKTEGLIGIQELLWQQICKELRFDCIPTSAGSYLGGELLPHALHNVSTCPKKRKKTRQPLPVAMAERKKEVPPRQGPSASFKVKRKRLRKKKRKVLVLEEKDYGPAVDLVMRNVNLKLQTTLSLSSTESPKMQL